MYLYRSIHTTKVTKAYKNPSENVEESYQKIYDGTTIHSWYNNVEC